MTIEDIDLLVVGGGKAGKTLAMEAAQAGQRVAMVERSQIGGTCINVACIPTKTLINSGRMLADARRAHEFGITGMVNPAISLELLRRRKNDVVDTMVASQRAAFEKSGMDFILGEASFVAARTVEIALDGGGTRTLRGADVVLNLGMEPAIPEIDGLAASAPLTSTSILNLESMPKSIIILGGGYIGCEFADLLATIGVDVTIVQRATQLLPREDADITAEIEKSFAAAGIALRLGVAATGVARAGDGRVTVTLSDESTVEANELLVALGRSPMTAAAQLQATGVELDEHGVIVVDEYLRTTAESVWAAGDAAGTPQFTHASYDDYRVLSTNIAANRADLSDLGDLSDPASAADLPAWRSTTGRLIPSVIFTTPELARVGQSETEARAAGHDIRVARMPVSAIPRARTIGHLDGVWKAVVDRESGRILGASLLGAEASEAITVLQLAMVAGLHYSVVRDLIVAHPTIAEGFTLLFTPAFLED